MTLCRQKWPNMQINMLQKPTERAKKRLIWGKNKLFSVHQNYIYYAATNAEKFGSFRDNLFSARTRMVHFISEIAFQDQISKNQDQKDLCYCYFVPLIGFC